MSNKNRYLIIIFIIFSYANIIKAQSSERVIPSKFTINSPLWSPKIKDIIVRYIPNTLDLLENNRDDWYSMQNFIEAAKKNKGEPYTIPPKDHSQIWSDGPVYNTFEAMCWALTIDAQGDKEIIDAQKLFRDKIEKWIPLFLDAMEPDGYICTKVTLNNYKRWANPVGINLHEDYLLGYFLECGMALYAASDGKDDRLLKANRKCVDLWCKSIGYPPKKAFQTCHPGLEQSLIKFAELIQTIENKAAAKKYYELALYLCDQRGTKPYPDDDLMDDKSHYYFAKDEPNLKMTTLHGHAVMNAYLLSGMIEVTRSLHEIYKDNPEYELKRFIEHDNAIECLWNNLVNRKMYVNGTIGSTLSEEIIEDYDLPNSSYSETCSSIGNMLVQNNMGLLHGNSKYHDILELTLYNGVVGALDQDCGNWAYCNPLVNNEKTKIEKWKRQHDSEDCCMSNISRTLLQLPTFMYSKTNNSIYINQFIGSSFTIEKVAGTNVEIVQQTSYPNIGKITLVINPQISKDFEIYVRIPNRQFSTLYQPDKLISGYQSFKLNGKEIAPDMYNGYAILKRKWEKGDKIEITIPMKLQKIRAIPEVKQDSGKIALQYGPLIYAVEKIDIKENDPENVVIDKMMPMQMIFNENLFGGVWTIKGKFTDGTSMLAIPFYARLNRDLTNKYCVWLNEN